MDTFTITLTIVLAAAAGAALGIIGWTALRSRGEFAYGRLDRTAESYSNTANGTHPADEQLRASLQDFSERLRQLETGRIESHAQLREHVDAVRRTNDDLRRETASLSTALRRPHVRGQWGEMHLRRTVEITGMVEHCDFDLQVSVNDDGQTLRPDMVVRLAGGRTVVVDAKAPLEAYLDAVENQDDAEQYLHKHAEQIRSHVDALAAKSYWRQFENSPEFVVLFLPSEPILSAALEIQPGLLEHASGKKVVLATPTTLIALLRTIAYAWTQAELAENARQILHEAQNLYDRIGVFAGHFDRVGNALDKAISSYNDAVGSMETRLLVSARRLNALGIGSEDVSSSQQVDTSARMFTSSEFNDHLS